MSACPNYFSLNFLNSKKIVFKVYRLNVKENIYAYAVRPFQIVLLYYRDVVLVLIPQPVPELNHPIHFRPAILGPPDDSRSADCRRNKSLSWFCKNKIQS